MAGAPSGPMNPRPCISFPPGAQAPARLLCRCAAGGPGARWRALSAASWPQFSAAEIAAFAGKPYQDVAFDILSRFAGDVLQRCRTERRHRTPPMPVSTRPTSRRWSDASANGSQYLLELFHGPTLAFKDIALQILGRLFARALARRGGRPPSSPPPAAIPARPPSRRWAGLPNIDVFVMHPKGRVSEVQRRQMTTSAHANVHNIALEGSFDDAQGIVKALFAETEFAARDRPDRRQLDQLRPHRGAERLLLHRHGGAGQARDLRRADRQFRRHLRGRGGDAHGPCRRRGW